MSKKIDEEKLKRVIEAMAEAFTGMVEDDKEEEEYPSSIFGEDSKFKINLDETFTRGKEVTDYVNSQLNKAEDEVSKKEFITSFTQRVAKDIGAKDPISEDYPKMFAKGLEDAIYSLEKGKFNGSGFYVGTEEGQREGIITKHGNAFDIKINYPDSSATDKQYVLDFSRFNDTSNKCGNDHCYCDGSCEQDDYGFEVDSLYIDDVEEEDSQYTIVDNILDDISEYFDEKDYAEEEIRKEIDSVLEGKPKEKFTEDEVELARFYVYTINGDSHVYDVNSGAAVLAYKYAKRINDFKK